MKKFVEKVSDLNIGSKKSGKRNSGKKLAKNSKKFEIIFKQT